MKSNRTFTSILALALASFALVPAAQADDQTSSTTPVYRAGNWRGYGRQFQQKMAQNTAELNKGTAKLIFIGDSITDAFNNRGSAVWKKYYAPRDAINLGLSGDRTQNALFRLKDLPLNKVKPKVVVVMMGVNNITSRYDGKSTPQAAANGIKAVVETMQKAWPSAKFLVLHTFPAGFAPNDSDRKKIVAINAVLPSLVKKLKNVTVLDINKVFLDASGKIPRNLYADDLHPSSEGYQLWAKAMEPTLAKLLGDKPIAP
ncbi:MAG: GDSL-type esterase/lipase family protein [Puniceicoccales bacterium]|jgi:beta-glucosidase|nr:GDSL-type esterase/lipase family protein [Puniceicoccales bacterium]